MRRTLLVLFGVIAAQGNPLAAAAQTAGGSFPAPCVSLPPERTPDDGISNDSGWELVNFATSEGCDVFGPPAAGCHHNDDDSALLDEQLGRTLDFTFDLFGNSFDSDVWVNNNGNLSFGAPFGTFTPEPFPLGTPLVAPFWADVDTGDSGDVGLGHVWYQELGSNALAVTWDNVGYFDEQPVPNTFQVLISDGTNLAMGLGNNVCFCYDDMQWTTGDFSGGIEGFGGSPATVGVNAGNDVDAFRVGEFDRSGTAFDGSGGMGDGVDFLDQQVFCVDVSLPNIPPIPVGSQGPLPPGAVIGIEVSCEGGIVQESIRFESPEANQVTTVIVNDSDNAGEAGLFIQNTPGQTAEVNLDWTTERIGEGFYELLLVATDDGEPPESSVLAIEIDVVCPDGAIVHPPTDPARPGEPDWAEAVAVRDYPGLGTFAFVAAQSSGLLVYDVSDPANVGQPVASLTPADAECPPTAEFDDLTLVDLDEAIPTLVAGGSCGLVGVDLADPTAPTFDGRVDLVPDSGAAIWAKEAFYDPAVSPFVLVAEFFDGLQIIDANMATVSSYGPADDPNFGNALALDVTVRADETLVYVATTNGLRIVDITDPAEPEGRPGFDTATIASPDAIPQDVLVSGDFIYLPVWQAGLRVLEIQGQGPPVQIQMAGEQSDEPYFRLALNPEGTRMLAAQGLMGLRDFTVGDNGTLGDLAGAAIPLTPCCWAWNLALDGNRVYVALGDLSDPQTGRLQVVDLPLVSSATTAPNDGSGGTGASLETREVPGLLAQLGEHLGIPTDRTAIARTSRTPGADPAPGRSKSGTGARETRGPIVPGISGTGIGAASVSVERTRPWVPTGTPARVVSAGGAVIVDPGPRAAAARPGVPTETPTGEWVASKRPASRAPGAGALAPPGAAESAPRRSVPMTGAVLALVLLAGSWLFFRLRRG